MAALYAFDSYPLPALGLYGAIPHSRRLSVAVAAACPHLTSLTLRYWCLKLNDDGPCKRGSKGISPEGGEALRALISLSGPKLRELTVTGGAHQWRAECFGALALCTALTKLELHAGSRDVDNVTVYDPYNQFLGKDAPNGQERSQKELAATAVLMLRLRVAANAVPPALCTSWLRTWWTCVSVPAPSLLNTCQPWLTVRHA